MVQICRSPRSLLCWAPHLLRGTWSKSSSTCWRPHGTAANPPDLHLSCYCFPSHPNLCVHLKSPKHDVTLTDPNPLLVHHCDNLHHRSSLSFPTRWSFLKPSSCWRKGGVLLLCCAVWEKEAKLMQVITTRLFYSHVNVVLVSVSSLVFVAVVV